MAQSHLRGLLWESLSRALEHHSWALAEYQDQIFINGNSDDLEQFRLTVVEPALQECERLRDLTGNNSSPPATDDEDEERRLVEQLEKCHQENLTRAHELLHPNRSMLAPERMELEQRATALQERCHAVRLALRECRKRRSSATSK
jgi:hypothetical protein